MAGFKLSKCLLLCVSLLLVCCHVQCQKDSCTEDDLIRLDAPREDEACGLVEGRVQLCEEGDEGGRVWKSLCDSQFTVEDAQVICRSLGYSDRDTKIVEQDQTVSVGARGVNCTGTEQSFLECPRSEEEGVCVQSAAVECFTTDIMAEKNCNATNKTSTAPSDSNATTPDPTEPGTILSPQTSLSTDSSTNTISTTTGGQATEAGNILSSPTLYYWIGGLIAFVLLIVLIVICSLLCCCGYRQKGVSPTDTGHEEKGGDQALCAEYAEDSKKKDYTTTTTHHQLQSSQPIYEAIHSNEASSTASQGSPSSKPANSDLYATLDQNNDTYAQIEPFIAAPTSATTSPIGPDPNSYYQPLDHRTGSMKRGLPSIPVQAVNRTALAYAKGEVAEGELSNMTSGNGIVAGSSSSLPRNTSSSSRSASHQPLPPHLERVDLVEQPNIYHTLEPPPEYSTLEQADQYSTVSTTAVCNNSRPTRTSHASIGKRHSSEHSPPFSQRRHVEVSPSLHPRSATLPSNHSSPHSSRTSSTASSPHSNRSNRSPLNRGPSKSSDSPSLTRGPSNSPQISQSKSNRFSSQSDGTDINMVNATLV